MQHQHRYRPGRLGTLGLVLAAGLTVAGIVSVTAAATAVDEPPGRGRVPAAGQPGDLPGDEVELGPATKYVLDPDGTVRRVR